MEKTNTEILSQCIRANLHSKEFFIQKAIGWALRQYSAIQPDRVHIVYNEFKNVATQIVRVDQYLPLTSKEDQHDAGAVTDYIYQPSKEEILDDLIPQSLKVKLYKAVLESNASEHGARMTAMDKATENAGELLKELRLTYNQTRQAAITKEILEIVAGAEALRSE